MVKTHLVSILIFERMYTFFKLDKSVLISINLYFMNLSRFQSEHIYIDIMYLHIIYLWSYKVFLIN